MLDDLHNYYMSLAIRQAQKAMQAGEVPTGCTIIDAREPARATSPILGLAHNQVELLKDPTAHAEILAITQAAAALGDWRLTDTVLYVTKEPCAMCAGAIIYARIPTVVYGVSDPKRGGDSVFNILHHPDLNHRCEVISGVCAEQCLHLLQSFFQDRRIGKSKD
ncbi:MAG: nucleoside deaminase [Verrucomicrobia bacterium]|nr:nucleoside deaminase [Verrucomicrobiota bacterium]